MKSKLTKLEKWQHRMAKHLQGKLETLENKHPRIRRVLKWLAENRVVYTILVAATLTTKLTLIPFWWTNSAGFILYLVYVVIRGGARICGFGPLHIIFFPDNWSIQQVGFVSDFLERQCITVSQIMRCERFRHRKLLPHGVFNGDTLGFVYLPDDFAGRVGYFWQQRLFEMRGDHQTTMVFLGLSPEELEIQATNFLHHNDPNFVDKDFAGQGLWVTLTRRGRVKRLTTITKVLSGWSDATSDIPADQIQTQ